MSGPYWDQAWNPVRGCTQISPGCANCWARSMHERFRKEPFAEVRCLPDALSKPLHWRKPRTVFIDCADLFHKDVPDEFIAEVFGVMAATPHLTYLVCTKRAERMREWFDFMSKENALPGLAAIHAAERNIPKSEYPRIVGATWGNWPLPNVWLGVTAEDQQRADERIPLLLATPAAHRWVSVEPMLSRVNLANIATENGEIVKPLVGLTWGIRQSTGLFTCGDKHAKLDQIIVGGESGPGARPCALEWIRGVVEQSKAAEVPCFTKQLGAYVVSEERAAQSEEERIALGLEDRWAWRANLGSRSGADVSEWPSDLVVRELAWEVRG